MQKKQEIKSEGKTYILNNGVKIPAVGLGTFLLTDEKNLYKLLNQALNLGYRHFDTAVIHENHEQLGRTFKKIFGEGKYKRADVFITSKVAPESKSTALETLRKILTDLQTDYLDLYLISQPIIKPGEGDRINQKPQHIIYAEMEECYEKRLTRAIGVSNYNVQSLVNVLSFCKIAPQVNQVEINPYNQQKGLLDFCRRFNIHVTAFAPLARGGQSVQYPMGAIVDMFNEANLKFLAATQSVTIAQIVLNYLVYELGVSVIPKTSKADRLKENISIHDFRLNHKQIELISVLDKHQRCIDPAVLEMFGHIDIFA